MRVFFNKNYKRKTLDGIRKFADILSLQLLFPNGDLDWHHNIPFVNRRIEQRLSTPILCELSFLPENFQIVEHGRKLINNSSFMLI